MARFRDSTGAVRHGRLAGDRVYPFAGDLSGERCETGESLPLAEVALLAPVLPSKVVCLASNYRDHAREMGKPVPDHPRIFVVPSTAVIGPEAPILRPVSSSRVDHEAELGVVIGRAMTDVPRERALDHVLGYTCVNDVTARDQQRLDGIFGRAKGYDSFSPLGPVVAADLDPGNLRILCRVNGELRQDGTSADMVFDVPFLLEFISHVMTLLPGDVVSTGTPAGVGPLVPGDRVEVEIEGIGVLGNPVITRGG